jgi:KDO2-lipid IV(A) lauroyltransferase
MQALHDVLEGYVRRYPDQWLWLHDRWKSARKRLSGTL